MAIRKILKIGHPILHRRADPINEINEEIIALARDMVETMHLAPGIGLAAPQVGVSQRIITIDLSIGEKPEELIIMINPEIIEAEGETVEEEGCLSVPEIREKVVRPAKLLVRGFTLDGQEIEIEAKNLLARVFSHELDHLDGKLFVDRLSPLKKSLLYRRLKKQLSLDI
ncbi:MAG: peptide deformylase [Candidatus Aminicenantes bacterium]|nr:peptide deformylase [Candidatus Aminicenantes bacterium]